MARRNVVALALSILFAVVSASASAQTEGAAGSKTFDRAKKLYDKEDYYSASIEFHKVITGASGDPAEVVQNAEFQMGKTLYNMGFYAASLAYFDRILQQGQEHRYHSATLKWLAALARVLPETSGILEKIGTYDATELDDPIFDSVRAELYFLLGRHFYRVGDFDQAVELFQRVDRASSVFIEAKFFEGVTYVRQYKGKPAVDAFKEILVIGAEKPKEYSPADVRDFEELARLQMARIFYSTQQYDTSIKYYEYLEQDSPDWAKSLFEASWAYFMKQNNSKALGNIHTLNAPYFENEFFPESILLKAVIYYNYCLYDRAIESVAEYNDTFGPLRDDISKVLGKYEDNTEFYEYVLKIGDGSAGLSQQARALVTSVLEDRTLKKTFDWVTELKKELQALERADKAWKTTEIASEVLQELTVQSSLAQADAGRLARERIERLRKELQTLSRDGRKIRIEILNAKADRVSAKMRGEQVAGGAKAEKIIVDDEHFMWKFNGEYWKDELGFYRFKIQSKCPRRGAKK